MARRGKTQKKRTSKHVLSIPQLRSSMEHMVACAEKLKHSKMSLKQQAKEFSSEWKRVFGKTLAPNAAEAYLKYSQHTKKFTRKHRGGAAPIAGAPLEYTQRAGTDLPYGNYTKYVDSGFLTPQPGVLTDAGVRQGVTPQYGMGSNRINGGGILDSLSTGLGAILNRPFVGMNPESGQHAVMSAWKGLPPSPGAASYQPTWNYISDASRNPYPQPSIYTRTLSQQGAIA
jgi:hypothetical protein